VAGIRARVTTATGDVLNVSATGALVRLLREITVGTHGPIVLDPEARRIEVSGRVVRCERTTIELAGGAILKQASYTVGIVFTQASGAAMQGIAQLCGGALSIEQAPYRVLVVSDDAALGASIGEALIGAGYRARLVTDARGAIGAAKESSADIAVVDLRESSMWRVLDVLESDPATARIHVLALTGPALNAEDQRYLAGKRVQVIAQPFVAKDLLLQLAQALRERV
jgi:CheY-like chemotaxis protein